MNRIIGVNKKLNVVLIDEKEAMIGDSIFGSIVLCAILDRNEYVTWFMNSQDSMHHVHYFQSLNEAIKDYEKRS